VQTPGGAQRNRTRIISRERGRKEKKNIYPNLAFLAPWREEYPNPRCLMYWLDQASLS
jgi:hypothetical protein